jgi:histidine ammonia-lyase
MNKIPSFIRITQMIVLCETTNIDEIEDILFNNKLISLSENTTADLQHCFDFLTHFASGKIIYGINTGFGPMAQYRIDDESLKALQYNLIRSHSTGAGNPLPDLYVKAAMLARLGTFMQGKSGIHPDLANLLLQFINKGIYPLIPEHGSVGASGDLVQLSHIALALIGEGEVHYKGEWQEAKTVFDKENLKVLDIHLREGLAATNGTSVMTGIGLVNLIYAKRLLDWSVLASVLMNEIASSYDDLMSEPLNKSKRHTGQLEIARLMREISAESQCIRKRENELYNGMHNDTKKFETKVQSYYSLRCVPQILGPILDTLKYSHSILIDELNSASDNPIIDTETQNVYHGGNFHGDYISLEMDKMKIAITKLTMLAERQLNYLFHDRINGILPPFVNLGVLGLNYGLQASQFTATSTTAECQTLSNPMYVHSIPNNNDNQDIVSMGTNSALITKTVIENSFQVMSIHFMALVQAVDYLKIQDKLSPKTREIYTEIRNFFPVFSEDTPKYKEIERMKSYLKNKKLNYSAL